MCTVAAIPIALGVASMMMASDAASASADARVQSAQYQAAVAANNAKISEQNATYAIQKGDQQAQIRMIQRGQQMGSARAAMAASGVRLDSGSPLNVQGDIAAIGHFDVETIRNNALREAYGYRVTGLGYTASSGLNTMQAGYENTAGKMGVMTSLVSGAASVSDKFLRMRAEGAIPDSGSGPS